MKNAEKLVKAAKELLGKEMDSANFISKVFKEAGVSFDLLRTVEKDSRERVTSAPGDVALIIEDDTVPAYYNPGIVIGSSRIIYVDPHAKKVVEKSAITLVDQKAQIVEIRRVMLS